MDPSDVIAVVAIVAGLTATLVGVVVGAVLSGRQADRDRQLQRGDAAADELLKLMDDAEHVFDRYRDSTAEPDQADLYVIHRQMERHIQRLPRADLQARMRKVDSAIYHFGWATDLGEYLPSEVLEIAKTAGQAFLGGFMNDIAAAPQPQLDEVLRAIEGAQAEHAENLKSERDRQRRERETSISAAPPLPH
jgi:hypothetical protein